MTGLSPGKSICQFDNSILTHVSLARNKSLAVFRVKMISASSKHPDYIIFSEQTSKRHFNKLISFVLCLFFISIVVSAFALIQVQFLNEDIKALKSSLLKIKTLRDSAVNRVREREFKDPIYSKNENYGDSPIYGRNEYLQNEEELKNLPSLNYFNDYLEIDSNANEYNQVNEVPNETNVDFSSQKNGNKDKEDGMHRIVKKSSGTEEEAETDFRIIAEEQERPVHSRHHHRNQIEILETTPCRSARLKSLAAIHFNGDTSHYIYKTHEHYAGNAKLRHPNKRYVDWKTTDWAESIGMRDHFKHRNGIVTVKQSGLYLIYAQIYFSDEHDENSYRVFKNMDEIILQCTVTAPSTEKLTKGNTCFTAGVTYLDAEDTISITDLSDERYSLFEQGKSFYGLIKLGDIEIK